MKVADHVSIYEDVEEMLVLEIEWRGHMVDLDLGFVVIGGFRIWRLSFEGVTLARVSELDLEGSPVEWADALCRKVEDLDVPPAWGSSLGRVSEDRCPSTD